MNDHPCLSRALMLFDRRKTYHHAKLKQWPGYRHHSTGSRPDTNKNAALGERHFVFDLAG
jgi:hypothetical protein